jgi:hypothetical protein
LEFSKLISTKLNPPFKKYIRQTRHLCLLLEKSGPSREEFLTRHTGILTRIGSVSETS